MLRARALTTVIVLAVSVAVPASALLACLPEVSGTPMAQMACCKGAKPDCPQASKALQCCKSTDHPQQQNVASGQSIISSAVMQSMMMLFAGVAPTLPATSYMGRQTVASFAGTTSPPHLLFSSLLI